MRIFLAIALALAVTRAWAEDRLTIAVDIPPVYYLVKAMVGDRADVVLVLDPQFSDHHFSLAPSQLQQIENADYVLGIGSWLTPDIVKAAQSTHKDADELLFYSDAIVQNNQDELPVFAGDPHFWLSPAHLQNMQHFFAQGLAAKKGLVDPEHLPSLNIAEPPAKNAPIKAPLLASHAAFAYFEQAFGYQSFGAIKDVQDQSLPPRQFEALIFAIDNGDIRCVLFDTNENDHQGEEFAENNGLQILEFDVLGWSSIESGDFFGDYFKTLNALYQSCGN